MKHVFIGEDKSMGFRCGVPYELKTEIIRNNIVVSCKELNVKCPYSSVEAFLRNWHLVEENLKLKEDNQKIKDDLGELENRLE